MLHRRQILQKWSATGAGALLGGLAHRMVHAASPPSNANPTARIRVGQIGVGHPHASKISVYRDSPDYEVVGIVEPNPALRDKAAHDKPYRDLPWMTQEQLLNVPGLQVVLVETPIRDLLSVAEICLSAGKHIHLDKPAGASLPHYRRVLDTAARQQLLVQMGYMYRYNPAVVLLRQFLKEGWLGEVFEVHAVMSKVVDPASRQVFAEFSGGILFELGGHITDLVVSVLGKPDQVHPYARQTARGSDTLLDNMLAVLEYPRATATLRSSALEVEGFSRRHLVVCGTEGTFHIQPLDDPAARIALAQPREEYAAGLHDIPFPPYTRYVGDAADMARILRGEKPCDFSYDHDWTVQQTLMAACGMA